MTLKAWVAKQGGPVKVAPQLNVTVHAVRRWLRKQASPRPETMKQIFELSKGKVTYKELVEGTILMEGEVVPVRTYTHWS